MRLPVLSEVIALFLLITISTVRVYSTEKDVIGKKTKKQE